MNKTIIHSAQGICVAIPINMVKRVFPQLMQHGRIVAATEVCTGAKPVGIPAEIVVLRKNRRLSRFVVAGEYPGPDV